jgi:ribonuclease HI
VQVGCAIINQTTKEKNSYKLPPKCSIFSAKAVAITAALKQAQSSLSKSFVICSDSKSVIPALRGNTHKQSTNWVLLDIKLRLYKLRKKGKTIKIVWTPSHCNIKGNEETDQEAKVAAEEGELLSIPIPFTDLYRILNKSQLIKWEEHWNQSWESIRVKTSLRGPQVIPWYRKVVAEFPKNPFKPWYCKQFFDREYTTYITRLRIGHGSYPEHLRVLGIQDNNLCECGQQGTLDHIFFNCPIHEEVTVTAQLNIAIDNLNLKLEDPRSLTELLTVNKKQIHDLLVQFIKHENILI